MQMMKSTLVEDKRFDLQGCLDELQTFVRSAAGAVTPVHEVERGLWRRLLQLGYQLQSQFFSLVGDGNQGETVTLAEGQVVRRLPAPHRRLYQSVFGPFEFDRVVYGTRESQQIEFVPVDARLGLPAGKFSYLLQDWDQALVVENPYQQVNQVLSRILGLEQSVASLEQMTHTLATAVDAFLKGNAEFQAAYPGAKLERVESNRGVEENRQGRYYLRYRHDGGVTEFWGYVSTKPKFDFKKGVVGVVATPEIPKL